MALTLTIGGVDFTELAQNYSFSNVAKGGFEQAQIEITAAANILRGATVLILDGADVAWHGFVNSPGVIAKKTRYRVGITCLGFGVLLKDKQTRMIFVDRDFKNWGSAGTARRLTLINAGYGPQSPNINTDAGSPALGTEIRDTWAVNALPNHETTYNAHGMDVGSVYYAWKKTSALSEVDTSWHWSVFTATDDQIGILPSTTAELRGVGPGSGTLSCAANSKFVVVSFYYGSAGGTAGLVYAIYWTCLAVYGNHGLTKRGTESATTAKGFYPSDIAGWAIRQAATKFNVVIQEASNYTIPHLTYFDRVPVEQMIDDAAKFVGWMWGTWEPSSVFDTQPTFRFEPPPQQYTCMISSDQCESIDEPVVSLDRSYNVAYVKYRDAAGTESTVTVAIDNPVLSDAGISERALSLDMGIGSSGAASAFGGFALRLAQASQRGGGSVSVAGDVQLPSTSTKPATLVRAGRDRIRIPDLNDGNLLQQDARSIDSFLVERVETTVTGGRAVTRIEFDSGADLMEVLNARMQSQLTAGGVQ